MALILLPLILSLVAWFVPSSFTRIFGILATLVTLVWSIIELGYYDSSNPTLVDFNLSIRILRFSIDSLGFTMLILTNVVMLLVLLSQYTTKIVHDPKFTALTLLMQFGLVGVFTTQTILGFYIFWELTLLPIFLILYWFGSFEKPRANFEALNTRPRSGDSLASHVSNAKAAASHTRRAYFNLNQIARREVFALR